MPETAETLHELVQQGVALVRAQNDQMTSIAEIKPRDQRAVLAACLEELDIYPRLAQKAFYSIPYKDNRTGKIVKVEGPSIDAATSLASAWGNCAVQGRYDALTDDDATLVGVFLDVERNVRVELPVRVSRWAVASKTKKTYRLNDDKWIQKIGAGLSKAVRNAILKGLPKGLVEEFTVKAKELAGKPKRGQKKVHRKKAIVEAFEQWNIPETVLCFYAGCESMDKLDKEGLATLRGLWNAINDGLKSPEEVMRDAGVIDVGGEVKQQEAPKDPEISEERATATIG